MHPDFTKQAGKDHVEILTKESALIRLLKKKL
ncbi:hypothetical protein EDD29_2230 [Actinocorallia herbida]|uniref:Uncharacterized protein n=1 Tax=Actinocorallia herbida TaxID=58109 RepID=A0A3N1CTS6_9ACTN|nr:hypothetical protein EDD29_2230 [Actinocorallia herbida]